jgi:RimJ/RimL family protein N-acetyltransferase
MMTNYILSTERLGLRHWIPDDEEPFIRMNQDPAVMEFFPRILSRDESIAMIGRIRAFFAENGYGLFAVELKATGEFIGFTGFAAPTFESFFTPCIEIGWRLRKEVWGKGYAPEAARACLQYGFDVLRLIKIFSFTARVNTRSQRVMQKIGMQPLGEFEHPRLEEGHPLRGHVFYGMAAPVRP